MSDFTIEDKIKKIRQDLYNFNSGGHMSLEKYLEENRELKFNELESPYEFHSPEYEQNKLRNSQSAENLKRSEEIENSPYALKYNPEIITKDKDFTINNKGKKNMDNNKDKEIIEYNQALLESLSQNKSKYLQRLADKDNIIAILEKKLRRTESELAYSHQGNTNIEELKSSTRDLKYKADELDVERMSLVKENSQLHQKLLKIEKELNIIASESYQAKEENARLKSENARFSRKLEEITKENEILYKTINERQAKNKTQSAGSYSPRRNKSPNYEGKICLRDSKRNHLSDDEKTERKNRSPSLTNRLSKIPRPRSRSKEYKNDTNHPTSCKILKEIMNLYSVNTPTLLISLIKSCLQDVKTLSQYKDFSIKIQKVIIANSPPSTFKNPPGLQASLKWIKRLIKEYLNLKKKTDHFVELKILDVLKAGLNSNSYDDIPRGISKLLVENEKLLQILSKVKRGLRLENNISIEDLEKEIGNRL